MVGSGRFRWMEGGGPSSEAARLIQLTLPDAVSFPSGNNGLVRVFFHGAAIHLSPVDLRVECLPRDSWSRTNVSVSFRTWSTGECETTRGGSAENDAVLCVCVCSQFLASKRDITLFLNKPFFCDKHL